MSASLKKKIKLQVQNVAFQTKSYIVANTSGYQN